MKATTSYKLTLIEQALKSKIEVRVEIRGARDFLSIVAMRNLKHSVLFTIKNGCGFVTVDPDDIFEVWVPKLPPAFDGSHLHDD